jgi:hypothetical protein
MLSKSDEFWDRFHSFTVTNINENLNIITLTERDRGNRVLSNQWQAL